MLLRLARTAVAIACLAALVSSQETGEGRNVEEQAEAIRRMKAAAAGETADGADKGKRERELEDEKNLTPEERLARHMTHGASQHCRFHISVHPAKLLPGQSGTVKVVAALQGKAVLPSPAPFEVVGPAQQGMLTLGAFALQPAAPGRLASAYLGRPVYDNYAVVELPVTMSPSAALGSKHVVAVEMKLDLYDGSTGQPIGRFLDRVATDIEVGLAPDPAVKGGGKPSVAAAEVTPPRPAATPTPTPAPKADLEANVVTPAAPTPSAGQPVKPAADAAPGGDSLPVEDGAGSLPMPFLIAGGVVVLAVVLLLSRRK